MSDTIPSIFKTAAEKFKDRILFNYFHDAWRAMTYGEFLALAERLASYLISLGLNAGDRAAIISENRPEWGAAYMAILMCGGIAVPLDMQLGAGEIKNLLMDSGAKVVFYSSKTEPNILEAAGEGVMRGINFDAGDSALSKDSLRIARYAPREASPEDLASIIYTSGTTGNPKGVMLTHGNFCADAGAVIKARVVTGDDNVLSVLPLHHTYPFMCTFLVPLFTGAAITFSPGLKATDLVPAIRENNVTVVVGVPRLFEMIRNGIVSKIRERKPISGILLGMVHVCGKIRRKSDINIGKVLFISVHKNFGRVRFFASGGARLDPSVMEDLEALGFTVLEGYGLTETSPVITFNPPGRRKPGSAGKPLPGVAIRISEDGEIMVKGPMVMKGYYKNPATTAEVFRDGELLTGDIGSMDDEGYLFITGRKKEVIVLSSGKNIYPEDVEKAYMVTPLIKEICVIPYTPAGIPSSKGDMETADTIQAVIVPDLEYAKRESIGNITEALNWKINEVSARLPEYMRIKGYSLHMEPLPRTPLGKLRRFMVRALEQPDRSEKQSDAVLMSDEAGKRVVAAVYALTGESTAVRSTDNLELDLGFDSLKKIELISSLESSFSISLPETFIAEVRTVGDVVAALKEYRGEGKAVESGAVSWEEIFEKEPSPEDAKKIGYSHGFGELAVIYILFMMLKILFKILFRLRVEGLGHMPEAGPFVITPNHASYLDGFIVAAAIPYKMFKKLYFLGLQQYFTGGIKSRLARLGHVIPIDSEMYLHKALQMSAYVLKSRRTLCIFPEGGRSFDGTVMPFKKGIGVLALELGIPVIPAYISGSFRALPKGSMLARPVPIRVSFGKPVTPSAVRVKQGADKHRLFADELRRRVIQLSNE
ncbi:MAG: AMP-binding protein [Nitrospirae bacterium]|nr:AMP-binding protein [Nitrospirota bacterium]